MPEPILLLRLEGPLQSWGLRSRWSRRDTSPEPTKSAIVGILGCAAGILRPDWRSDVEPDRSLERWDRALNFGVRTDRRGMIETDYHTVQGRFWQANGKMKTAMSVSGTSPDKAEKEPPHTEITWRDYVHDAAFLVALAVKSEHRHDNHDLLERLKNHLQHPKWPLFLGRKACVPSRPVFDRLTDEYEDMEAALRAEPWARPRSPKDLKSLRRGQQGTKLLAWLESSDGNYERQDAIRLNQLRFYDFRRCRRIEIDVNSLPWRIP
ncbi:MAG TPA: type I-E CRISPR-associated protein Cas5/CasD [Syntrophorhabdus aromaticivorans]|nr:type I-E CRISPR-associated protein Cas5/CasD [Syntrophorhabdus aromaticivorans]